LQGEDLKLNKGKRSKRIRAGESRKGAPTSVYKWAVHQQSKTRITAECHIISKKGKKGERRYGKGARGDKRRGIVYGEKKSPNKTDGKRQLASWGRPAAAFRFEENSLEGGKGKMKKPLLRRGEAHIAREEGGERKPKPLCDTRKIVMITKELCEKTLPMTPWSCQYD